MQHTPQIARKEYIAPAFTEYPLSLRSGILADSVTEHPVVINSVTVEDFTIDSDFHGIDDPAGTWTIGF